MKNIPRKLLCCLGAALVAVSFSASDSPAADDDDVISQAMKKYHKAPKGEDSVTKRVEKGEATEAELKELNEAYVNMAAVAPPEGDAASWKEKMDALLAAMTALQAGEADAPAAFKEAVNCKACHKGHKPD